MSAVWCENAAHVNVHPLVDECIWPHEVAPSGAAPSMTAAETLDPRQAVTS
ncbi:MULTISPECIES: hypothetical protein [Cryobacterium]|uniref:hypothetical protein n=1 Tax=Cryobacterium TaxID=69578 RepID=UPI00141A95BA|nr:MULTISPECIES: hypothetical protein [Cryobacterium]